MSVFDVRGNGVGEIKEIIFAEENGYEYPYKIVKCGTTCIELVDEDDNLVTVKNENIPNLILALQKTIELGWIPTPKLPVKKPAVKKPTVTKAK